MKQQFKIQRFMVALLMICAMFATSTVIANDNNSIAFANVVLQTDYERTYEAFDMAYNVEDATVVISKATFKDFSDENVYDLLSLTYSKEK